MNYKALGQRIRKQRKAIRWTQEVLAEKAGISLSFLGHIERGSRKASLETLVALSNALCISTDVLLQDSLESGALLNRSSALTQGEVLREIGKLLKSSGESWE